MLGKIWFNRNNMVFKNVKSNSFSHVIFRAFSGGLCYIKKKKEFSKRLVADFWRLQWMEVLE